MAEASTSQLWKLALEELQVSISPASFGSWIKTLNLTDYTEIEGGRGIADIDCLSAFHQSLIEQRFYGQIKEAIDHASEQKVELRFHINGAGTKTDKPTQVGPLFEAHQQAVNDLQLAIHRVGLREDFTFKNFAVSSSNEMAYAAAKAISDNFGNAYNPLFLYGGVGVGKTHLMQAVAMSVLAREPQATMIYCMGEEFTNEIIDAIQQKTTRQFKKRYRQVRGLFIDDIQFIAGKTTVQEEFFHTFNAILKSGGQVIMTSDRPPGEIKELEARLRSRFEAGLIVDIGQPDFELRSAITLIKAQQRNLNIKMDAAQAIAANIESARKIEGFLVRLHTEAALHNKEITITLINSLLGKTTNDKETPPPPLRPLEIIKGVADYYKLPTARVRGTERQKQIVTSRHLAMYLLRIDYKLPLDEVGQFFSNRDHTTVMHAVAKITQQLQDSQSLRNDLGEVRKRLYS